MKHRGLLLLPLLVGCSSARMLAAGDHVPDVTAVNQEGARVSLAQFRGHPLVVYFYPKDRTSGCTVEAHEFRTEYARFRAAGAEVVGVSNDGVASHKGFCTDEGLPFPLLADTDEHVAHAFGVPTRLGFYRRTTFVIDGAGVVRHVFDPVQPTGHAREVLSALAALPASPAGPVGEAR
jgi:peroxiredoxin Q/BCP